MGWIAEWIIQEIWGGAIAAAYRKAGVLGGVVAFLLPIMVIAFAVWLLVR